MESNSPTLYDIAYHFCVSRISGATIPATRLSKILESMFHGQPLTALSLKYLEQQRLIELHQLASGQITYEAFIAALDPALVAREQADKAKHQAQEAERLAQKAEWAAHYKRKEEEAKAARIAHAAQRTAQLTQLKREQEAARARSEAEWATQCTRNREAAAAAYTARMSEPDYTPPTPYEIAQHYRVSHLPDAVTSPLSNILEALYKGLPLAAAYSKYLKVKRFSGLYELAIGQATYESYLSREIAQESAEAARLEALAAQKRRADAAEAARIARNSDPAYILRKKYGIYVTEQPLLPRLMNILQSIDSANRLTAEDVVWLNTEAKQYFTEELRKAYHLCEAKFCAAEYQRTLDPWNAINASGHYRKCDEPASALELLNRVPANRVKNPKIHSALCTTHGGVMRDLGRHGEALQLGRQGHELQPQNFRPCTLLGAVCMELGSFAEAHDWYAKAEERGASRQSIDSELKSIFLRADKTSRETMKMSLLALDPKRYHWVNDKKYHHA